MSQETKANNMRTFWRDVLGAQFPGDAAAKKSSGDRIWKLRFAPALSHTFRGI